VRKGAVSAVSKGAIWLLLLIGLGNISLAQKRPPAPYNDRGACPFECCTYRQWTVEKPTVIRTSMRDSALVGFRLRKGERVQGVTGVVITSIPGIARVLKRIDLGGIRLATGDRVYLFTNEGEGYVKAWYKGRFFSAEVLDPELYAIERHPRSVWWVKVRSRGKVGWSRQPENFGNIDQCG
jgi:hypothetical protein